MPSETEPTFAKSFKEWVALIMAENPGMVADLTLAKKYSDWLDREKYLTPIIALLGMTEARKVDQAVMQALIEEIGEERAKEIVKPIVARYGR